MNDEIPQLICPILTAGISSEGAPMKVACMREKIKAFANLINISDGINEAVSKR